MKNHTIPLVSFVELAATGNCVDRQHQPIQKGSHGFTDSKSINRKGTEGKAPCIPNNGRSGAIQREVTRGND